MLFDRGRLLESETNGMAIFVLPNNPYEKAVTLMNVAKAAYEEWMSEVDELDDEAICDWVICDWVIKRLKEKGFEYEKDYRIFTDLNWD